MVSASIAADPAEKPVDPDVSMEDSTVATTEGDDKPQISRKQVLKKMKLREARKKRRKTKRLGGKHSHSKW